MEGNISFKNTTGAIIGLSFIGGVDKTYKLSVDYLNASFEVDEVSGTWLSNSNSCDISGILINISKTIRF
jgi:hypothetical protein